jgi:RNA polymerase sigma factor (sigma-70 family)
MAHCPAEGHHIRLDGAILACADPKTTDPERELAWTIVVKGDWPVLGASLVRFMYRRVAGRVASLEDRKDITQDIGLKLLKRLPTIRNIWDPNCCPQQAVKCWLEPVIWHHVVDYYRRSALENRCFTSLDALRDSGFRIPDSAGQLSSVDHVHKAIEKLGPRDQTIFNMILNGLTYPEMSEVLGLPRAAVKVVVYNARQRLKKQLKKLTHA